MIQEKLYKFLLAVLNLLNGTAGIITGFSFSGAICLFLFGSIRIAAVSAGIFVVSFTTILLGSRFQDYLEKRLSNSEQPDNQ